MDFVLENVLILNSVALLNHMCEYVHLFQCRISCLATKKNCDSDGTCLLITGTVILKNESHYTNHRVNAHICVYCNLESPCKSILSNDFPLSHHVVSNNICSLVYIFMKCSCNRIGLSVVVCYRDLQTTLHFHMTVHQLNKKYYTVNTNTSTHVFFVTSFVLSIKNILFLSWNYSPLML